MGCFATRETAGHNVSQRAQMRLVPTHITLHYFDIYGRAEVIRMVLQYLRLSFSDHRFGAEEWVQLKSSFEFQDCPMLEIDGKRLSETRAILRYLCMTNGLYPSKLEDIYWCESLCDFVDDICLPLIDAARTSDIVMMQKAKNALPERLQMVEKRLLRNQEGKAYFIGSTVTIADFMVFNLLWDHCLSPDRREDLEAQVPKLLKLFTAKMLENTALKEYVDTRRPKPY